MSVVSLAPFILQQSGPLGSPCWCPPAGVTALCDLVPPVQDPDPEVNYAVMVSDDVLPNAYHTFGSGDASEIQMDGAGRDAWQSVTGYRPTAATVADCLAQHLLTRGDPTGTDFAKPLTAGFNRRLSIHLGREVWSHTLGGVNDPLADPVMRAEAEALAEVYTQLGETPYRLAMGYLRLKYSMRPIRELIEILYPAGRVDLPLMDELHPATVKNETWPSGVSPTSGQDQTWVVVSGSWTMHAVGSLKHSSSPGPSSLRLEYAFSGADMVTSFVAQTINEGSGVLIRSNAAGTTCYLTPYQYHGNAAGYKTISGSNTVLLSGLAVSAGNTLNGSAVGSSIKLGKNGINHATVTDTAVASGSYLLLRGYENGARFGLVMSDDQVSASTARPSAAGKALSPNLEMSL